MAGQRQIGGGKGSGGNLRGGGGSYSRTPSDPMRLTKKGKTVAGGATIGAVWKFGKWIEGNDKKRQSMYDGYLKGYDGSAQQRSGMTQNDWVRMQMEKRNNAK